MKLNFVAAAVLAVSSFAASASTLNPAPSATFGNTHTTGSFDDNYSFTLTGVSSVAASITNVSVSFAGSSFGGIANLQAFLNGVSLNLGSSSVTNQGVTVSTQVLAGATNLPAGVYQLQVKGDVIGASASYGGNIVAAPIPEPSTYALLLAGLGAVGFVARRRNAA